MMETYAISDQLDGIKEEADGNCTAHKKEP